MIGLSTLHVTCQKILGLWPIINSMSLLNLLGSNKREMLGQLSVHETIHKRQPCSFIRYVKQPVWPCVCSCSCCTGRKQNYHRMFSTYTFYNSTFMAFISRKRSFPHCSPLSCFINRYGCTCVLSLLWRLTHYCSSKFRVQCSFTSCF